MADENDGKPKSLFAEVQRQAKERRAISDRRSQVRRAAELREVARQLALREASERKPAANANDTEPPHEAIKDDPA